MSSPIDCNEENITIDTTLQETINSTLETKAARQLEKVLGTTHTLILFDNLRERLKLKAASKKKQIMSSEREEYKKLLAQIHTKLILQKYQLKEELKGVELSYYKQIGACPTIEDKNKYTILRRKIDVIKKTLSLWHSFTLK